MPTERKYSGGPVISLNKVRTEESDNPSGGKVNTIFMDGTFGPWFLGIDRGRVPLWNRVYDAPNKQSQFVKPDHWVEANTGIACVIPAWKIIDILNKDELVKQRERDDAKIAEKSAHAVTADFSPAEKPFTKEDFEDALTKVTRKLDKN